MIVLTFYFEDIGLTWLFYVFAFHGVTAGALGFAVSASLVFQNQRYNSI